MAQKNYFAVVHRETGKMLLISGGLPIFWRRDAAKELASSYSGYIVQPVDIKQLEKLILSKSNKKAK